MLQFYRYLIYRLYSWRLEEKDDTPVATIVFMMSAIHFAQALIIGLVVVKLYPSFIPIFRQKKVFVVAIFFLISFFYYLLIYKKERWDQYIEEFKDESVEQRKRKGVWVWLFTWGSIFLFFILAILLFVVLK